MSKNTQSPHKSPFEEIKRTDPDTGGEFWSSRDFYKGAGIHKLSILRTGHQESQAGLPEQWT